MAATTVKVHRRKAATITEAPRPVRRPKPKATTEGRASRETTSAAPSQKPAPAVSARKQAPAVPAPTPPAPAKQSAASLLNPVRPATSRPLASPAGAVLADPFIATRARRGTYPLEAPSWHSFRNYVTDRSDFDELRAVGMGAMMRAHREFALALAAVIACVLLVLAVIVAYFALSPATADADSPYLAADAPALESTPVARWKAGEIPSLYQSDAQWGSLPYGQATMAGAGAAPTALAMAYVAVTGDTTKTPADFAQWAIDHDQTASGADTVQTLLSEAAGNFGLALTAIDTDAHSLRRAIVSNIPVLVVTEPGTFQPVASVVVLDDIDRDSRIVLHDPASAMRTNKSWAFDDITTAALAAYEVHAA